MKSIMKMLFVAAALALLGACGGSGGGGGDGGGQNPPPNDPPLNYTISGSVLDASGAVIDCNKVGTVQVTLDPGAVVDSVSCVDGSYSFTVTSGGDYTLTPSLAGHTFTPASKMVTVSGSSVTGINFVMVLPNRTSGLLYYMSGTDNPNEAYISMLNFADGTETQYWGGKVVIGSATAYRYPDTMVIPHAANIMFIKGPNIPCMMRAALPPTSPTCITTPGAVFWYPEGSFDASPTGDVLVLSSGPMVVGDPDPTKRDVILLDGTGTKAAFQVTSATNGDRYGSPVFCSDAGLNKTVNVCYVKNDTEIWMQSVSIGATVDASANVGAPVLVASDVAGSSRERVMSPNGADSTLVYMNSAGGITKLHQDGTSESLVPQGMYPYCTNDGSVMYTIGQKRYTIALDGAKQVLADPSNPYAGAMFEDPRAKMILFVPPSP